VIFWGDRAPRRALIAAGACTALTISANQTAVFSAFLLPLFALSARRWKLASPGDPDRDRL
jgi:hypothetical protein